MAIKASGTPGTIAGTIEGIENELLSILQTDKKSWVEIYRLIDAVEQQALYRPVYASLTAWINALADKAKVHVSLIWQRKKAGKYYEDYRKTAEAKGRSIPTLEQSGISPETLSLVEKVAGTNEDTQAMLMDKVIAGDMGRADLKRAWAKVKNDRSANGLQPTRTNRHTASPVPVPVPVPGQAAAISKRKDKGTKEDPLTGKTATAAELVTAAEIVHTLVHSSTWLEDSVYSEQQDQHKRQRTINKPKYKVLTEVAVRTGSSHNARRIDALVLENMTTYPDDMQLHGIEIKVSQSDLLHDYKMNEYTDFVDYFWIAVPEDLLEDVKSVALPTWGIITIKQGGATVRQTAQKLTPVMRDKTLSQACYALM